MIKLERPIVFLDTETTGTDVMVARIVELAMVKLMPDLETRVRKRFLINPEVPIPKEASDVHGITDDMVKDAPILKDIHQEFLNFIEGCDIGTFNGNRFDIPLIYNQLASIGVTLVYKNFQMVDCYQIFAQNERRDLAAACQFYAGRVLEGAHGALADTEATVDVFLGQMYMYDHLPQTVNDLAIYCNGGSKRIDLAGKFKYNQEGEIVLTFGEHNNKVAKEVFKEKPSYVAWMLRSNFSEDTKNVVRYLAGISKQTSLV